MELLICEKPSQAESVANFLGMASKNSGFIRCRGGLNVTWAYGHILEQFMPDDYDASYKSWSIDHLPIIPSPWQLKVKSSAYKQYKVVLSQIKEASCIWIATDYDREGELIAREIIEAAEYQGLMKRLPLRGLDSHSIETAFNNAINAQETYNLYLAGLARMRADWLVGMNLSRLYTGLVQASGVRQTIHIGRVLTPTIALVCARDKEIDDFKPSPFYEVRATLSGGNSEFQAKWICPEEYADEKGRCINQAMASQVCSEVVGYQAAVSDVTVENSSLSAPLPFHLSSLQQYASKKWGFTADQVLGIAQSLYETHKVTSYPRTDCRYLPESQHQEAQEIVAVLKASDSGFEAICDQADLSVKPRCFNDDKVEAHHAIIPTLKQADIGAMRDDEFKIYDAIRRAYVAQFFPSLVTQKTSVKLYVESPISPWFLARSIKELEPGWRVAFEEVRNEAGKESEQDEYNADIPDVNKGQSCPVVDSELLNKKTTPPERFTDASLLAAMESVARFVDDNRFKAILKETSGLGTTATRASIIEGAIKKGYLHRQKKQIRATQKAHGVVDFVPGVVTSAGMTAAWEQELEKITSGARTLGEFMGELERWIEKMVEKVKESNLSLDGAESAVAQIQKKTNAVTCPTCKEGELVRKSGKYGKFWCCNKPECRKTFDDNKGKPRKGRKKKSA